MIIVAPTSGKNFVDGLLGGGKSRLKALSFEVTLKSLSNLQSQTEGGKQFQILGRAETLNALEPKFPYFMCLLHFECCHIDGVRFFMFSR